MCLTYKIFLQTHVTFCEYLVFHEFKRNLYITLAKYLEQEGIANLLFFNLFIYSLYMLECPFTTELFQKNGYDLNAYNNVRDILYNTDVLYFV